MPASAVLTASNGEGSYDATVPCSSPGSSGPSWRYGWTGLASSTTGLLGEFNATAEVHNAGDGHGYIPDGAGRISIELASGGIAYFDFDGGDCASAPLTLEGAPSDTAIIQPSTIATGTLPVRATLGTGAARGLSGIGEATITLELTPGGDNAARINLSGDFSVRAPNLKISGATAMWANANDYLARRLTVYVTLTNNGTFSTTGDAFNARLTGMSPGSFTGLPASGGRIPPGGTAQAKLVMSNATRNQSYTVTATATSNDGLGGPQPAVSGTVTFKAPLLP